MKKLDSNATEQFEKLSNYADKLKFWDKHELDYKNTGYLTDNGLLNSILPKNSTELAEYAKWNINHHRNHFINEVKNSTISSLRICYKDFIALQDHFICILKTLKDQDDRNDFYKNELEAANKFIANITSENCALLKVMIEGFRKYDLISIYKSINIKSTSAIVELRKAAKLWDIVQYKTYLEQKSVAAFILGNTKISFNKPNVSPLKLINLSAKQTRELFSFLKDEKFLDGTFFCFSNMLKQKPMKIIDLKWIDRTPQNNGVYHYTLFTLIHNLLIDITVGTGDIYDFIIQHFYTPSNQTEIDKIKRQLTSSYHNFVNQKNPTSKQNNIEYFIKSFNLD